MKMASSERPDHRDSPPAVVGARASSPAFCAKHKSESTSDVNAAGGGRAPVKPGIALPSPTEPARKSRLWLWFVLAFILQLGAWVAWFTIANQHRVATVPLVTTETSK